MGLNALPTDIKLLAKPKTSLVILTNVLDSPIDLTKAKNSSLTFVN